MSDYIEIKGARVNNLKNVSVKIPRNKLVVVAGVSGSGKSSLAFDTLYAEGQRRYVESLSSYARQFLGRMNKPECDYIRGIPPAIAIEQKVISRNPRSTVGTTTEIYEYLRLLYARIGHTYSPVSGEEVKKHSTEDIIQCVQQFQPGTKFVVMAPVHLVEGRTLVQQLQMFVKNGYVRMAIDSNIVRIDDWLAEHADTSNLSPPSQSSPIAPSSQLPLTSNLYLVIDRLSVDDSKDSLSRLIDSAETAFYEGHGELRLMVSPSGLTYNFSQRFEVDGMTFEEQMNLIEKISGYINVLHKDVHDLVEARKVANRIADIPEKAKAYSETVAPFMAKIREKADKLEMVIDDELWPLPKYRELQSFR